MTLPLEQKAKIIELRAQGLSYFKIRQMIMELYKRATLSLSTIHKAIHSPAELEEAAEEVAQDFLDLELEEKVRMAFNKKRNKAINDALLYRANMMSVIEEFKKHIKPIKIKGLTKIKNKTTETGYFVFGDLHYGRTTNVVIENIQKLFTDIINTGLKDVTLVLMGDNFESPILGGMHEDQVSEMDVIGVKQVLGCMDLLIELIISLAQQGIQTRFIGLTGNHDRMTKSSTGDPERIAALLGYSYLEAKVGHFCEVIYSSNKTHVFQDSGLNFIMHHGDHSFNTKNDMAILNCFGKLDCHNIIISGHWHNSSLSGGSRYNRIFIPSMNISGNYEKNKFIASNDPGYVYIDQDTILFRYFREGKEQNS